MCGAFFSRLNDVAAHPIGTDGRTGTAGQVILQAVEAATTSIPDFEAFVEGSADLLTVLESNGTVRYQNAAVERVCGYARADVVGENFFEYVHPDDRARLRSLVRASRSPGSRARTIVATESQ